jgi:hydroxyacylglutathione hydrolase
LLSVPASNISALPDEPDHFLAWLRKNQNADAPGYTFAPGVAYAKYIEELLREAKRESTSGVSLEHIRDRAFRFIPTENGFDVLMEKRPRLSANLVILSSRERRCG